MTTTLPEGVVTGVGAVDVLDPHVGAQITIDEVPDLPHVPELPLRGPWAEPVGRLAALLVDLPVELEIGRWRMASGVGRDLRRSRSLLAEDLDAVEEHWAGFEGPAKLQLLGPLSAAALVELRNGAAVVSDAGAVDELGSSLAEGLLEHVAQLSGRVPGAEWVVQVDEPLCADVARGRRPRPSGWGTFPALEPSVTSDLISRVVDAAHRIGCPVVVHCCDPEPDWDLLTGTSADALSVPLRHLDTAGGEGAARLERWWGSGRGLWSSVARPGEDSSASARLRQLRSVLGAPGEEFGRRLVLTPPCAWDRERLEATGGNARVAPVGARAYGEVRALAKRLDDG